MRGVEVAIHTNFSDKYHFEDPKTGERFSAAIVSRGEFLDLILEYRALDKNLVLVAVVFDFKTFENEGIMQYWFYTPGNGFDMETQPIKKLHNGEAKVFFPGEDDDLFMAAILLKSL